MDQDPKPCQAGSGISALPSPSYHWSQSADHGGGGGAGGWVGLSGGCAEPLLMFTCTTIFPHLENILSSPLEELCRIHFPLCFELKVSLTPKETLKYSSPWFTQANSNEHFHKWLIWGKMSKTPGESGLSPPVNTSRTPRSPTTVSLFSH